MHVQAKDSCLQQFSNTSTVNWKSLRVLLRIRWESNQNSYRIKGHQSGPDRSSRAETQQQIKADRKTV